MRDAAGELADGLHLLALREILLQRALLGGVEREDDGAGGFARLRLGGRDEEARGARGVADQGEIDGRDIGRAFARRRYGGAQRGMVAIDDATVDRGPVVAIGRLQRGGGEPGEGAIGAQDITGDVNRGDRHRRRIEDAGKARLGGAGVLGAAARVAGLGFQHQRARRAGKTLMRKGDAMQQSRGQEAALPALEIDVEDFRRDFARLAGHYG